MQHSTSTWPIVTRSKAGIFKSNIYKTHFSLYQTLKNTQASLNDRGWKQAMELKYNALFKNQTWSLILYSLR